MSSVMLIVAAVENEAEDRRHTPSIELFEGCEEVRQRIRLIACGHANGDIDTTSDRLFHHVKPPIFIQPV